MPRMDGVEATRSIMSEMPCSILVVTSTVSGNISKVYEAMGHGALDAVETPSFASNGELNGVAPLLDKIERIQRLCEPRSAWKTPKGGSTEMPALGGSARMPTLVLVGASTGGPKVVAELLANLPRSFPASVLIAQHVDEAYASGLSIWLANRSILPV